MNNDRYQSLINRNNARDQFSRLIYSEENNTLVPRNLTRDMFRDMEILDDNRMETVRARMDAERKRLLDENGEFVPTSNEVDIKAIINTAPTGASATNDTK